MKNIECACIIFIIVTAIIIYKYNNKTHNESYRNIVWSNRAKMYQDYYPRANGSTYGNCNEPWDMFSGFPVYPKAY